MYAFLAETNFYAAAKSGYAELGMFGTEACVMVEHPEDGAVCHPLTVGEYWIAARRRRQAGHALPQGVDERSPGGPVVRAR
jgi:hypothetical protein